MTVNEALPQTDKALISRGVFLGTSCMNLFEIKLYFMLSFYTGLFSSCHF